MERRWQSGVDFLSVIGIPSEAQVNLRLLPTQHFEKAELVGNCQSYFRQLLLKAIIDNVMGSNGSHCN